MYVNEGTYAEYEKEMERVLLEYKAKGVAKIVFGDIFLEDFDGVSKNQVLKLLEMSNKLIESSIKVLDENFA